MNPRGNPKHGGYRTLAYSRWKAMRQRCLNPKAHHYALYGGAGITICARWLDSFSDFLADMGECPDASMTLDRRDHALGYEPGNCRWALKSHPRLTHGASTTLTYARWRTMIDRCHKINSVPYRTYGAQGVTVCEAWRKSFAAFLADMGDCPSSGMTVDRVDNARGYEPGNCRWATRSEQGRNRTNNTLLTLNGVTLCIADWAERLGIPANRISARLHRGWSIERALTHNLKEHP